MVIFFVTSGRMRGTMFKSQTNDMTVGKPSKLLLAFAVPMLIGNLFQQLYNMVDSIVVGNFVGANALAAVGATSSLNFLFVSLCMGLAAGIGIIISQYYGARDYSSIRKSISTAAYTVIGAAIIMGIFGIVLARPVLMLLNTPAAILDDAVIYMRISCAGMICVGAYNGVAAILRALGDSLTPLIFLVVACVINIVLDLLFVIVFQMGVAGVALATIIAQLAAAAGCLIYSMKKVEYFRIPKKEFRPDYWIFKKCVRIGVPVALQNSFIAFSCIILQSVVNGFGEVVVAAYTVGNRFEQLVQQPMNSLGAAIATFTGQNIGAGDIGRVKKGYRTGSLLMTAFSLIMIPIAFFGGEAIMRMFTKEAEVIAIGSQGIRITSLCYVFLGMIYVSRNVLNGAGDIKITLITGLIEVVGRVGFAKPLTMIAAIGYWGIWITNGLTWFLTAAVGCGRYWSGKWKDKSVVTMKKNT